MRTTIIIDDTLITEALALSDCKTKSQTVEKALKLFIAQRKQATIHNLRENSNGTVKSAPFRRSRATFPPRGQATASWLFTTLWSFWNTIQCSNFSINHRNGTVFILPPLGGKVSRSDGRGPAKRDRKGAENTSGRTRRIAPTKTIPILP